MKFLPLATADLSIGTFATQMAIMGGYGATSEMAMGQCTSKPPLSPSINRLRLRPTPTTKLWSGRDARKTGIRGSQSTRSVGDALVMSIASATC